MSPARANLSEHRDHDVDVHTMVAELTRPHQHREHYVTDPDRNGTTYGRDHIVRAPSLLDQLEHSQPTGGADTTSARGFASRPAARLEPLDALAYIEDNSTAWCQRVDPTRPAPAAAELAIARLGGLLPQLDRCYRHTPRRLDHKVACCRYHEVEDAIRSWWATARAVAGWDTPAWQPDGTCPVCGKRGTLRVRISARVGFCTDCHEFWTAGTLGLLGEHIRVESFRRALDRTVEPCWCPWPTPIERMGPLCSRCGSARCHRAVAAGLAS